VEVGVTFYSVIEGETTMTDDIILLVEDNPDDEALTLRALKKGHVMNPVVVARDGVEALEWLFGEGAHAGRDTRVQPQVILLDLNMPRLSGLEVLERIRADHRTRTVPVVVLTSSKQEEDMFSSYTLGANSYVRKPVDFAEFIEAVGRLGVYWLLVNQQPPRH
jgi:two-component system response regulator